MAPQVLKLRVADEVYRLSNPQGRTPSFKLVKEAVKSIGHELGPSVKAKYVDDEGDECTLCSETFDDFLTVSGGASARLLRLHLVDVGRNKFGKDSKREKRGRKQHRSRSGSRHSSGSRRSSSGSSSSSSGSSGSSGSGHRRRHRHRRHRRRHSSRSSSRCSSRNSSRGRPCLQVSRCDGKMLQFTLEESFPRDGTSKSLLIPGGSHAVQRAFYGDRNHPWDESKGMDVTEAVKTVIEQGLPLMAQNRIFGDPIHGVEKVLIVDVTAPPMPVSAETAAAFVQSLTAEYVDNVHCGVGKYFEESEMPSFEQQILESYEKTVRAAPDKKLAIEALSHAWNLEPLSQAWNLE